MVRTSIATELFYLTRALLLLLETASPLELLSVDVPRWVPLGSRAALACSWVLGPQELLYSVKWYKDGEEFFRHVPRVAETKRTFPLPGVGVADADSCGSSLVLSPASLETAGRYRCEVSGERPLFPTVSHHADMEVVVFPERGPIISGFRPKYRIGDRLHVNCSSGHSRPATQLSWHVNGEPLPADQYSTSYRSDNSLILTTLTLSLKVTELYFRKSALKVKCLATIPPVYWKSNEETAALEKTTVYPNIGTRIQEEKAIEEQVIPDQNHSNLAGTNLSHISNRTCLFLVVIIVKLFIQL